MRLWGGNVEKRWSINKWKGSARMLSKKLEKRPQLTYGNIQVSMKLTLNVWTHDKHEKPYDTFQIGEGCKIPSSSCCQPEGVKQFFPNLHPNTEKEMRTTSSIATSIAKDLCFPLFYWGKISLFVTVLLSQFPLYSTTRTKPTQGNHLKDQG